MIMDLHLKYKESLKVYCVIEKEGRSEKIYKKKHPNKFKLTHFVRSLT